MKKALSIVLSTILLLALLVVPAQAAETVTLDLPVTQTVTLEGEGAKAEDAVVNYTFTAVTAGAPMPAGAGEGDYSFQLIGNEEYQIPTITYSSTGVWQYKLDAEGADVDPQSVDITVYVTRQDGKLTVTVVAMTADGEKCDLNFEATVKGEEPEPEPPAPTPHTVTFETGEGSDVDDQIVNDGDTATEPEDPTWEGYTFEGWYLDEECTSPFDFSTPITEDITLYAKWTKIAEPEPVPTGEVQAWSLINLICVLLTVGVCAIMTATMRYNGKKLLGILPAAAAAAIFLINEHMSLPMQLCDKFTPLMVGLLAVNVMLAYLTSGKTAKERTGESD